MENGHSGSAQRCDLTVTFASWTGSPEAESRTSTLISTGPATNGLGAVKTAIS